MQSKEAINDNQSCQKPEKSGSFPDLSFAQQVRDRRRQEGLSQAVLAERVGISRNYLSQIERGKATNLSWQVRQRLVSLLGIEASSSGRGNSPNHPTSPDGAAEPDLLASLPAGLGEFAAKAKLPQDDVLMLAGLRYRGQQPTTSDKWELLYNVIKMTVDT